MGVFRVRKLFYGSHVTGRKGRSRTGRRPYENSDVSFLNSDGAKAIRPSDMPLIAAISDPVRGFYPPAIDAEVIADDRVKKMRRAAALQVFELLDLQVAPGQLWRYVDRNVDPGNAVISFLTALGLDIVALQGGSKIENERANELLELLVEIDTSFNRLSEAAIAQIEDALFSGEYQRVREAVKAVAIYERIVRLEKKWPPEKCFKAATEFFRDVQSELDNPIKAEFSAALAAEKIVDTISLLLERFNIQSDKYEAHLAFLAGKDFADWSAWETASDINALVNDFDILRITMQLESLALADIAALIDRLGVLNSSLKSAIETGLAGDAGKSRSKGDRSGSSGGKSSKNSRSKKSNSGRKKSSNSGHHLNPLELALFYFGFSSATLPKFDDVKKAYRKQTMIVHPDHGGSNEDFHECQNHWDVIRSHQTEFIS